MIEKNKCRIQIITCILATIFLIYGSWRGEISVVLNKATNICLECIGLG
ncbi:CD1871A family CXXC motif-containing protein [Clostridium sp. SHJSY1]|nr:CD1871A family CXXC motif-containing protein [Clostridium sp. SHJSY1]MDS0528035.1 CD1871A family CXXC motif-containing protein [Clostridium sp. SHJSY1]